MFHTGRDCGACHPLLFPSVKIKLIGEATSHGNPTCAGIKGIYATFQENFTAIDKDI